MLALPTTVVASTYSDWFVNRSASSGDFHIHEEFSAAPASAADPASTAAAVRAAGQFPALTIAGADTQGRRRWVVWQDGAGETRAVHLALWSAAGASAPVDWRDGYLPVLSVLAQWRYRGQPVAAVQVQYGAAATEIALYGIGADDRPVRLDDRTAAAAGWRTMSSGEALLVTYAATGAGLVPTCLRWTAARAKLVPAVCPRG